MSPKNILITGATGQQGRALLDALTPKPDGPAAFHILALTRSSTSPTAKSLASEKHVTVVEGNLNSVGSVRKVFEDAKATGGIWGVFCVLAFPGLGAVADGEEKQGKMVADLSLEYGVSVFIYSSDERGGDKYDDEQVLSRRAKVNIERHVRQLGEKGLPWTILRPGFFMQNYNGTIGSITVAVIKAGVKPTTTLALIAAEDIGRVAAGVFENPDDYRSQTLVVVGDILTMLEQEATYRALTGQSLTSMPKFLARFIIAMNNHTKGLFKNIELHHQVRINGEHTEFEAQVALAKRAYPMRNFKAWVEETRAAPGKRDKDWNQVSLGRLLTGKL